MIRSIIVAIVVLNAGVAWSLDWSNCYKDLKEVRKVSTEAMSSTVKLRDLYDRHEDEKFRLETCLSVGGDCQYLRLSVNALLIDYGKEKTRFDGMMQSIGKATLFMKEACGYKFDANMLGHAGE
jgi:hypothetical protein